MDSLSNFVVFVQVAEARSFVAAGRVLGVSASAIGKSVARLEEKLGVRLFHRSTRSVTLTAEGALFLERSRRILAEIEAAEHELSQATGAPRGRLRVSLPMVSSLSSSSTRQGSRAELVSSNSIKTGVIASIRAVISLTLLVDMERNHGIHRFLRD